MEEEEGEATLALFLFLYYERPAKGRCAPAFFPSELLPCHPFLSLQVSH